MKTNRCAIFFISTILLIAQPSNCFDANQDLEAYDIYHDILGLDHDAVPTDPLEQSTFFSEDDYETQHAYGESFEAFPDDALLALPFESMQADPDASEYLFDRSTFRLADTAHLPLQKLSDIQPHFGFATQQPSTAAVATRSLISRSRKRTRKKEPYTCTAADCPMAFPRKRDLCEHITTVHNGIKRIVCTVEGCTTTFTRNELLQGHLASAHGKEKAHKCPRCPKAFVRERDLARHIAGIHEGIKRSACTVDGCNRAFARNEQLALHMMSAHGQEKPHKCTSCNKNFARKGDLKRHREGIHEGIQRFPCPECTNSFSRESARDSHLLQFHDKYSINLGKLRQRAMTLIIDRGNHADKQKG